MSQDKKAQKLEAATTPPGRVVRDKRGHTVWQWTDEESAGSTSVLLKFLDHDALCLEPTQSVPIPAAAPCATGGESIESTSAVLRRLGDGQFALEPTWNAPAPDGLRGRAAETRRRRTPSAEQRDADAGPGQAGETGGFDPYDHS